MTSPTESPAPASNGAVALIREAMASKADPAYLRELLAVREQWEASEARKTYNLAVSDFQRQCPIIEKADDAYGKAYARLDRIWREIRPLLTGLGLSATWQICELKGELCRVEGQLRHRDGHGEKIVMDVPLPELIKGQNKAQQMASASTYAKRYTLCAALGIVTGDDSDGNIPPTQFVSAEQARTIADKIDACRGLDSFNEKLFWEWAKATCPDDVKENRYSDVIGMLDRKLKPKNGGAK